MVGSLHGWCDPKFEAVREAFSSNFTARQEIGAAIALSVAGRTVVDLWGGVAGPNHQPWQRNTLVDVFSVGKAMVALSVLVLMDRGQLAFDDPVARHWPEFAQAGKESVTVAQLMSHQAGLPGLRRILPEGAMYDWDQMTASLAAEPPWWEPGTAHGYHVNTFGFLGGELVRRVGGQGFARFFAQEIAAPTGADFRFGLNSADSARTAEFVFPLEMVPFVAKVDEPITMIYGNPSGISGLGTVNSAAWRGAVHPSTNGHATARAVVDVYAVLAGRGAKDRVRLLSPETLRAATTELVAGPDRVLERRSRFGFGLQLTDIDRPLGPGRSSFGHYGAGGSLGFADPDAELAFGYVMNRYGDRWQDPRNQALVAAAYDCL